jgi:hypothetical protein
VRQRMTLIMPSRAATIVKRSIIASLAKDDPGDLQLGMANSRNVKENGQLIGLPSLHRPSGLHVSRPE